ncbi:hypothetical protein [Lacticaseibacillus brantae]|uniref:Uncharacterized protein n=1 Tax=Lacticaseibacillus brantae DSM 23927 TaxID=1423727 RepID=A0A0R2AYT2_9LACO|nr:hypothetical protein [Lacticaseibacillus brantae]KRM71962.1 hypothetical protein FC34_GL000942 [Lacticaseibacillus brantae DSM 23927]
MLKQEKMIRDAKEAAIGSWNAFDSALEKEPALIIPLALIHLVPIAMVIHGAVKVAVGHQHLKIEREKTKQVMLQSGIPLRHGRHPKFKIKA